MTFILRGGPLEAAGQLIRILEAKGILDKDGNVVPNERVEAPRGPIDAFIRKKDRSLYGKWVMDNGQHGNTDDEKWTTVVFSGAGE